MEDKLCDCLIPSGTFALFDRQLRQLMTGCGVLLFISMLWINKDNDIDKILSLLCFSWQHIVTVLTGKDKWFSDDTSRYYDFHWNKMDVFLFFSKWSNPSAYPAHGVHSSGGHCVGQWSAVACKCCCCCLCTKLCHTWFNPFLLYLTNMPASFVPKGLSRQHSHRNAENMAGLFTFPWAGGFQWPFLAHCAVMG